MCNKLLQTYACGHSKSICTTPCTHALKSTQLPVTLNTSTGTIMRSNSTVSSLAPAERSPSTTNFSRPNAHHSPLRVTNVPSTPTNPTSLPAFRFVAASTPSPTSPVSPVSLSFAAQHGNPSAPPSRFPSLSQSTVVGESEPQFCSYYIPRYLVTSKYPCIECYNRAEWEGLRGKWMENYRLGHPLDKIEDVGVLSGVEGVMRGKGDD